MQKELFNKLWLLAESLPSLSKHFGKARTADITYTEVDSLCTDVRFFWLTVWSRTSGNRECSTQQHQRCCPLLFHHNVFIRRFLLQIHSRFFTCRTNKLYAHTTVNLLEITGIHPILRVYSTPSTYFSKKKTQCVLFTIILFLLFSQQAPL